MKKRRFTFPERYAVWHWHGKRCWFCTEPLRLQDATIDHFFPESLLLDDVLRLKVLCDYGLQDDFNINGFENWLPCHGRCNQEKGRKILGFIPGNLLVLQRLIELAPKVEQTAREVSENINKDKVFSGVFAALERKTITTEDLQELLAKLGEEPPPRALPDDIILLDGGYWVFKDEVAREGYCLCEKDTCVESNKKVYCYFRPDLPQWVINAGLYWKCYDEVIDCPRCNAKHKRGHIGKEGACGLPYSDQQRQQD